MKAIRYLPASLGVVALCLALVIVLIPNAATVLPVSDAVDRLGNDYMLVGAFGLLAFAPVVAVLVAWLVSGVDRTPPPEPERVPTGRRPGAELDRLVRNEATLRSRLFTPRRRVRERLRETAVRTVMRTSGCSRSAARNQIDRGAWTDDREAAAFLAGEEGPSVPHRGRLAAALHAESWSRRGARRAGGEIVRRAGAEDRE